MMKKMKKGTGSRKRSSRSVSRSRLLKNLMARKEEVERAVMRLVERQKGEGRLISQEDVADEFNHAEREISAQTHYSLLERKSEELKKIDLLIRRVMESDDFGRCEECGESIPEQRLMVMPDATLCVSCQREMEKLRSGRPLDESPYPNQAVKEEMSWVGEEETIDHGQLVLNGDGGQDLFLDVDESELEEHRGKQ